MQKRHGDNLVPFPLTRDPITVRYLVRAIPYIVHLATNSAGQVTLDADKHGVVGVLVGYLLDGLSTGIALAKAEHFKHCRITAQATHLTRAGSCLLIEHVGCALPLYTESESGCADDTISCALTFGIDVQIHVHYIANSSKYLASFSPPV